MKQVMLLKVKRGGGKIVRKEGVDETVDDGTEEVAVVHQEVLSCRELYLDRT